MAINMPQPHRTFQATTFAERPDRRNAPNNARIIIEHPAEAVRLCHL
jgi:hypothetical protein